jgi:Domain of unknown function (DUF4395)
MTKEVVMYDRKTVSNHSSRVRDFVNGHGDADVNQISAIGKARIEAQGFVDLDDRTLAQINYWLRLAPAICMVWVAIGTALSSAAILWALVPLAALGALLTSHPFDVLYNYGLRYLVHSQRLPRYPLPRRFGCLMATVMIAGEAWSFQSGHPLFGYILGWSLVAAASANVSIGFCVPSYIYGMVFGKPSPCASVKCP